MAPVPGGGWRRTAGACLLLLMAYGALSLLNSPRGFLGTDTGGKVATLRAMEERGRFDPDLGYWAEEWDPAGELHPIALTSHVGDRWVNVTTLPALWAGWHLYGIGGYRAALLVPMLGAVAASLAALVLARQLGADRCKALPAFWLVGLASPLTIYALDFWEHSLGVALCGWSVVLVLASRAHSVAPAAAGFLVGAATTMRTETLIYAAVIGVALIALRLSERRMAAAVGNGALFGAAAVAMFGAGAAFERQVLGTSIRPARAAGTALGAGTAASTRLEEALETTVGVGSRSGIALGGVIVLLLIASTLPMIQKRSRLLSLGSMGAAAIGYVAVIGGGLSFVPGLGPTTPFAAIGATSVTALAIERHRRRVVFGIALGAMPLVLLFQYVGGAGPQWGGRYLLPSTFLLLVAGWVRLSRADRPLRLGFVALSIAITAYGLAWLSVRSHLVDLTVAAIERHPEPVIVSTLPHLAREGGATYGSRRWLTKYEGTTPAEIVKVLDGASVNLVAVVEPASDPPLRLPGFKAVNGSELPLFADFDLRVTSWQRDP